MAQIRDADASIGGFNAVATLIICAAAVGVSYACDRAYRRWSRENHPFAGPRARVEHMRSGYRERRATVIELAQVINSVIDEVSGVTSTASAR